MAGGVEGSSGQAWLYWEGCSVLSLQAGVGGARRGWWRAVAIATPGGWSQTRDVGGSQQGCSLCLITLQLHITVFQSASYRLLLLL